MAQLQAFLTCRIKNVLSSMGIAVRSCGRVRHGTARRQVRGKSKPVRRSLKAVAARPAESELITTSDREYIRVGVQIFLSSCWVSQIYLTALRMPPGCAFKIGASGAVGLVDCWLGFVLRILFSQNSSDICVERILFQTNPFSKCSLDFLF